jgi:ATP-binding cassette subfamily B protein
MLSIACFPCVIHWKNNHFVVVYKITKNKLYVSDPAKGLVSYNYKEFIKGWYKTNENDAVIDIGIYTRDIAFIYMMLTGNIVLLLSVTLSNVLRDWVLLHVSTRVNISLISDYLIKLMKLPVTFFENKLVGDILQRAYDHERIRSFVMNNSLGMLFSMITFLVFSVILLVYNPGIFFIFIAGSFLYVVWILTFLSVRKKLDWEYFDSKRQKSKFLGRDHR